MYFNMTTRMISADHKHTLMALWQFRSTTTEFTPYHAYMKGYGLVDSK
jgi:hypothetical protein